MNPDYSNASWYAGLPLEGGQLEARREYGEMCWQVIWSGVTCRTTKGRLLRTKVHGDAWLGRKNQTSSQASTREQAKGWNEEKRGGHLTSSTGLEVWRARVCFVGHMKAGLVNHVRKSYAWHSMVMVMEMCAFCDKPFLKQGITMHTRYCQEYPNRKMSRARW